MATAFHQVNNNAASVLASALTSGGLSAAVSTGEGAEFDSGKQYLTIGRNDPYPGEIVDVTSRSSDTFTLASRGADGTSASAHEAGDRVEALLVAAHITEIQDAINAIENGTVTLAQVKLGDDTGKLIFGNDSDIQFLYDEATDDRLEITDGTNVIAYLKDLGATGLFGVTGRAEIPQIGIAADTDLITLTADTVTVAGKFDAATGIIARQSFLGGNQYASLSPSADSPCFIYNRPTDTASVSRYGIECRQEPQPGGTASGTFAAVVGSARVVSNQTVTAIRAFDTNIQTGSGTSVAISADSLRAAITNNGTGTITSYRGVRVSNSGSTGIVTNFYGLDVEANTSTGANANGATAKYGLRIGDISGAGTTNRAIETGTGAVVFGDSVTMNGAANVMGDASTDALTFTGRCVLRSVTDAGPMTATGGTQREIVFNTSDSKFYGCTVTHATAATWVALN